MLYVVRFFDRPNCLHIREAQLPAHVQWLDQHRDTVLIPGSLRPDAGEAAIGGLWLVEAPSKAAIEQLLETDPFWTHGLRERYEIYFWSKAFPDRKVPV